MRKTLRTLGLMAALMLGMNATARAQSVTVSGDIVNATTSQLAGASGQTFVRFRLLNFSGNVPKVSGTGVIPQYQVDVVPNSLGHFTTSVYGNDSISPSNTYYRVEFWIAGQLKVAGLWSFTTAACPSGCNLDTYAQLNPVSTSPVPSGAVLLSPSGNQTINTYSLILSGGGLLIGNSISFPVTSNSAYIENLFTDHGGETSFLSIEQSDNDSNFPAAGYFQLTTWGNGYDNTTEDGTSALSGFVISDPPLGQTQTGVLSGFRTHPQFTGAGTSVWLSGIQVSPEPKTGTGTVQNYSGVVVGVPQANTPIASNNYGIYIDGQGTGNDSTVNVYGLYINTQGSGTNDYAIYSAGGKNFFGSLLQTPSATLALATSAISANTCAAAQTATLTGLTTSSVVKWSFASTPIGVTGYGTGGLHISTFATANTANVVVCNATAGSITPGAMSLNLRGEL